MSSITILNGNLVNFTADVIVNSSNSQLKPNSGINKVIFEAAGKDELLKYFGDNTLCNVGDAVTSPAFKMTNTKHLVHAVGPDYKNAGDEGLMLLYKTYMSIFEHCKTFNAKSIALPLISAGISGFPADIAWKIAIRASRDYIAMEGSDDITIFFLSRNEENVMLGRAIQKTYEMECPTSKPNEIMVLKAINQKVLYDAIDSLTKYNQIEIDEKSIETKTIAFEVLDKRIYDGLFFLGRDNDYLEHIEDAKSVQCSEMNVFQIRTMLTFIKQGEKFCNGHIRRYIEDKTLVKLFLRIDDLLAKYEIGELQKMLEKEVYV